MRREVHVRFCERLAVRFRGPTLLFLLALGRKIPAQQRRTIESAFSKHGSTNNSHHLTWAGELKAAGSAKHVCRNLESPSGPFVTVVQTPEAWLSHDAANQSPKRSNMMAQL